MGTHHPASFESLGLSSRGVSIHGRARTSELVMMGSIYLAMHYQLAILEMEQRTKLISFCLAWRVR